MLTYATLELTVCFTVGGDILHYAKKRKEKKVSVGGRKIHFSMIFYLFLSRWTYLSLHRPEDTLGLKDLKSRLGVKIKNKV